MKAFFALIALTISFAQSAQADRLLCASKKNESLYYTTGQIRLTAEIANTTLLSYVHLSTTASEKLGSRNNDEVEGIVKGGYARFDIGGDAWCSYKLALPKGFMTQETATAFVDAQCEENANSSIRLYCTIQ